MKVLSGHVSPETAYVVDDYPYGYKLRCKIRYWVETKKGFGMRFVSQTTNPKRGDMWNKPKPGNYYTFITLYLDEHDHVDWRSVSLGQPGSCMKFYYSGFYHQLPEDQRNLVNAITATTWKVNPDSSKRRDEILTALRKLNEDSPNLPWSDIAHVKVKVEELTHSRYYESDFADIYGCWLYDRNRSQIV